MRERRISTIEKALGMCTVCPEYAILRIASRTSLAEGIDTYFTLIAYATEADLNSLGRVDLLC
jgi:hypothetical protein